MSAKDQQRQIIKQYQIITASSRKIEVQLIGQEKYYWVDLRKEKIKTRITKRTKININLK